MTFIIVQEDTAPPINSKLYDSDGPIDLSTGISNIRFHMEDKFNRSVISDDLTGRVNIVSGADGEVEYTWKSGDTDTVGTYKAEWQILYDDGKKETFPTHGKITVEITEQIE